MAETCSRTPGELVAIGVGPGDPELLTLKGVRLLRSADVVITPVGDSSDRSIALSIIADYVDPERQQILERVFPMRRAAAEMEGAWKGIAAEIAGFVRQGQKVAFVTLGDPMLYSTYLYLQHELEADYPDIACSTVPGISSAFAAANRAKLPLGLGSDLLTIVPATLPDETIRAALNTDGTVVLLKVNRSFDRLRRLLDEAGLLRQAVFVRRLGLDGEQLVADLTDVGESDLDYLSLILARRGRDDG